MKFIKTITVVIFEFQVVERTVLAAWTPGHYIFATTLIRGVGFRNGLNTIVQSLSYETYD